MKFNLLIFFLLLAPGLSAQSDSLINKLSFTGDFRFRVEQDWDSRKSDGTYRDDRTRFRYRFRFGMNYQYNEWASFGMRIRTGQWNKQQDPQLTLGHGFEEFGTLPIGFEKVFFKASGKNWTTWLGKNTFPFEKQNEIFWSDNVYPEGVYVGYKKTFDKDGFMDEIGVKSGHFVISSRGQSLDLDSYFQGFQVYSRQWENRVKLFADFYYFNRMPDIPDGFETTFINYSIGHLGGEVKILKKHNLSWQGDFYYNFEDYTNEFAIATALREQNQGWSTAVLFGGLENKGDWKIKLTYTRLERFSAVDFLAQNDWIRWDYSSYGSPDGRLTNFEGIELKLGYAINKRFNLLATYFTGRQLVKYGPFAETGSRVRFDLNIGF